MIIWLMNWETITLVEGAICLLVTNLSDWLDFWLIDWRIIDLFSG
jgi:hypothetical protein